MANRIGRLRILGRETDGVTPRKLTDEQVERIRVIVAARRSLPTNAQLAIEMDCCKRLIDQFTRGRKYKVHVEHTTTFYESLIELSAAKP